MLDKALAESAREAEAAAAADADADAAFAEADADGAAAARPVAIAEINPKIEFGELLVGVDPRYSLQCIVRHDGSEDARGHYTSDVAERGRWLHYNDSVVTETSEQALESSTAQAAAYMLFYVLDMDKTKQTAAAAAPAAAAHDTGSPIEIDDDDDGGEI
jgi:hypothetical protein